MMVKRKRCSGNESKKCPEAWLQASPRVTERKTYLIVGAGSTGERKQLIVLALDIYIALW